jgi:hypothetical protein
MKGFNTSLDYSKLWDLIHNDFRIPAWILQSEILGNPIFDLVEVRMLKYRDYPIIGTRGISYSTMENTKEAFINNCKSLQMVFIIPKEELERGITITHVGKQDTLEEAAEIITTTKFSWQQERSYSEEEVLNIIDNYKETFKVDLILREDFNQWFEQFKKK